MNLPATTAHFSNASTLVGRVYSHFFKEESSTTTRVLLIIGLALCAHLAIQGVGAISERIIRVTQNHKDRLRFVSQQPKFVTILRLTANTVTWAIYFLAMGLFLEECGVNLTAYLASASVIGLAISFGSQGLVQDMVIGLTLIFSDAMDVDDMVEIVGNATVVGRVQEIGLRFTKVINLYNQVVFIPNRTVANVSRFPHGGIYAYADVQVPPGADQDKAVTTIKMIATGMYEQFGAIIVSTPIIDPLRPAPGGGWDFVRVRFMIWPGQGALIEITFRQHVLRAMKAFDPGYSDWQVPVLYRASKAPDGQPSL